MLGFAPVARTAQPCSVPKNQYSAPMVAAVNSTHTRMGLDSAAWRTLRALTSRGYLSTLMGRLDWPMMRRFTEYSASWVRMPARMAGMPQAVCSRPVTRPAAMPERKAATMAAQGFQPPVTSMMNTAPPVHMVPSTVRSATSRIL